MPCLQIAVISRQMGAELGGGLAASDRDVPPITRANGTLMARRRPQAGRSPTCHIKFSISIRRTATYR
jgi:hypothetical protein